MTSHDAKTLSAARAKAIADIARAKYLQRCGATYRAFEAAVFDVRLDGCFYDLPPAEQTTIEERASSAAVILGLIAEGKATP